MDGKIIKPEWFKGKYKGIEVVNATNIDWEDIATGRDGGQRTGLFTYKQNHDRDVTTTGAAMSRHDMPLPEIPC